MNNKIIEEVQKKNIKIIEFTKRLSIETVLSYSESCNIVSYLLSFNNIDEIIKNYDDKGFEGLNELKLKGELELLSSYQKIKF